MVSLTNLVSDEIIKTNQEYNLTIEPYQLLSFKTTDNISLEDYSIYVPLKIISNLNNELLEFIKIVECSDSLGIELPTGTKRLIEELPKAMKDGRYFWVKRVLNSYIPQKLKENYLTQFNKE